MEGRSAIELEDRPIVLGRGSHCEVRFDSPLVSQCHCCLTLDARGVVIQDLGSTNGTRIDDNLVAEGLLNVGDILSVARHRYRFEVHRYRSRSR